MLPKTWKPKNCRDLLRVGPRADGGYVLPKILLTRTKLLIGLGVSDNWDFEREFHERTGCKVVCYDHTVTARFWRRRFKKDLMAFFLLKKLTPHKLREMFKYIEYKRFFNGKKATHFKLMVGYDLPGSVSLNSIIESQNMSDMFVKIDIEGAEYRVLEQLKGRQDCLLGFAIEFHDTDVHRERISRFIDEIEGYRLVHIHANNHARKIDAHGDPLTVEMTFLREDLVESDVQDECDYPIEGLDFPNSPKDPDLILRFEQET